jgi:hypothetical protein
MSSVEMFVDMEIRWTFFWSRSCSNTIIIVKIDQSQLPLSILYLLETNVQSECLWNITIQAPRIIRCSWTNMSAKWSHRSLKNEEPYVQHAQFPCKVYVETSQNLQPGRASVWLAIIGSISIVEEYRTYREKLWKDSPLQTAIHCCSAEGKSGPER